MSSLKTLRHRNVSHNATTSSESNLTSLKVPRAMSLNALKYIYLRADVNQDGSMSAHEVLIALRALQVIGDEHDDVAGLRLVKRVFDVDADAHSSASSQGLSFDDFCRAYATLRRQVALGRGGALMAATTAADCAQIDDDLFPETTEIRTTRYGRESTGEWVLKSSFIRGKSEAATLLVQIGKDAAAHSAGQARVFWWVEVRSPKDSRVLDALQDLFLIPAAKLKSAYSSKQHGGFDVHSLDGQTTGGQYAGCLIHASYMVNVPYRHGPPRFFHTLWNKIVAWNATTFSARRASVVLSGGHNGSQKNPFVAIWDMFWRTLCGRQPGAVKLLRKTQTHETLFSRRLDAVHAVARALDISALDTFGVAASGGGGNVKKFENTPKRLEGVDDEEEEGDENAEGNDNSPDTSPTAVDFTMSGRHLKPISSRPHTQIPRGAPFSILADAQDVLKRHEDSHSMLLATIESAPDEDSIVHIVSKVSLRDKPPTLRAPAVAAFATRNALLTLADTRPVHAGPKAEPAGSHPADIVELLLCGVRARLSAVALAQGTCTRDSDSRIVDGPGALLGALLETIVCDFTAGGALQALEEWADVLAACIADQATSTVSVHIRVLSKRVDELEAVLVNIAGVLAAAVETHASAHAEKAAAVSSSKTLLTTATTTATTATATATVVDDGEFVSAGKAVAELFKGESYGMPDSSFVRTARLFEGVRARCKLLRKSVGDL